MLITEICSFWLAVSDIQQIRAASPRNTLFHAHVLTHVEGVDPVLPFLMHIAAVCGTFPCGSRLSPHITSPVII